MAREATKAVGNQWYEARKKASKYDSRLLSREGAAELLGMSVSAVADAELGTTKVFPVDKAVLMADLYKEPWLLNYYCLNECPIGCHHCISDEINSIEMITVKLIKRLRFEELETVKNKLLDIADDGIITNEEKPHFEEVLIYLENLAKEISSLKMIGDQILHRNDGQQN